MTEDDQTWPPPPARPPPPKMMRCPNCGADNLSEGTAVCPICSVSLGQAPPPLAASLCGMAALLLTTSGALGLAILPSIAGSPPLRFLIGVVTLLGLGLLAFSYLASFRGGRERR